MRTNCELTHELIQWSLGREINARDLIVQRANKNAAIG